MKSGKLKYAFKINGNLVPAGTEVSVIEDSSEYRASGGPLDMMDNPDSNTVAIILPGRDTPTIHDRSHVIIDT